MKWFQKKAKENKAADRLAGKLANLILKTQEAFARRMNKITKGLSIVALKWALCSFLLFGTLFSVYVGVSSLSKKKSAIEIKHLSPVKLHGENDSTGTTIISRLEFERLQQFVAYIDSLRRMKSPTYDSIVEFRPGLLDSVKLLRSFYKNQLQDQK